MSLLKSVYMPFRRIWLDDDEKLKDFSDGKWLIFMPVFTIVNLAICISATWAN